MRILLFDNLDSFTWNLAHEIERVDQSVVVEVKTAKQLPSVNNLPELIKQYDAVVLSPGPGMPAEAKMLIEVLGISIDQGKPVLGICLGLQAIVEYFGGELVNLEEVLHGRVTQMIWVGEGDPQGVFSNIEFPCNVGHYHSWVANKETFPKLLKVETSNEKGMIMAISHSTLPIRGFQFHPESILTPDGRAMLHAWLQEIKA